MIEWLIASIAIMIISIAINFAQRKKCEHLTNRVRILEKKNTELLCSIRVCKNNLQIVRKSAEDEEIAQLRFQLYRKQEQIDELQNVLKKQRILLEQKWSEGKKCLK